LTRRATALRASLTSLAKALQSPGSPFHVHDVHEVHAYFEVMPLSLSFQRKQDWGLQGSCPGHSRYFRQVRVGRRDRGEEVFCVWKSLSRQIPTFQITRRGGPCRDVGGMVRRTFLSVRLHWPSIAVNRALCKTYGIRFCLVEELGYLSPRAEQSAGLASCSHM
jgi:hypothetical protein